MPNWSISDRVKRGRMITETYPHNRIRLRAEILPELTSWLLLIRRKYELVIIGTEYKRGTQGNHPWINSTLNDARARFSHINELIRILYDKQDRMEYLGIWESVCKDLDIDTYVDPDESDEIDYHFNNGGGI